VHLVGFTIEINYDAQPYERQIWFTNVWELYYPYILGAVTDSDSLRAIKLSKVYFAFISIIFQHRNCNTLQKFDAHLPKLTASHSAGKKKRILLFADVIRNLECPSYRLQALILYKIN